MDKPTNLRELVERLTEFPAVLMLCDSPNVPVGGPGQNPETFLRFEEGLMWFQNAEGVEHHLPFHRGLEAAAGHESGLEIRDDGFDFTKFGTTVRVRYAGVWTRPTTITARDNGERVPAILAVCACGCETWVMYAIEGKYQHAQCTDCGTVYCQHEGSCKGGE